MRRLATLLWLALATPIWAETVPVRSGEHADFSRVVFPFDRPTDWALDYTGDGYVLTLERSDLSFDFSRVFRFIPRTRLSDIAAADGRVDLPLACDCHAEAFLVDANTLVVDFFDGPPETQPMPEPPEPEVDTANAQPPRPDSLKRPSIRILGEFAKTEDTAPDAPAEPAQDARHAEHLQQMQEALLRELSRAGAQGLVEPDLPQITPPESAQAPEEQAAPALPAPPPQPAELPIHVETAVDRGLRDRRETASTTAGRPCYPNRYFDVAHWANPDNPLETVAHNRTLLVEEFDRPNPDVVLALARAYVFMGFGAEARAVLSGFDTKIDGANHLLALADIMDHGETARAEFYADQLACDSKVAFWAALSAPHLPKGRTIETTAIQREFSGLPLHLRRHLGPLLAERFLEIGDRESAARIRNAISRAPGQHGEAYELMEARLKASDGHTEDAVKDLGAIVAEDGSHAPDALVLKVRMAIDSGQALARADVENAEALAFTHRGTAQGNELAALGALGRAHLGDFEAAFKTMRALPRSAAPRLPSQIIEVLAKQADDATFLTFTFQHLRFEPSPSLFDPARSRTIERLLALGFPEQAAQILGRPGDAPTDRLLWARLELARGHSDKALSILGDIASPAAQELREDAQTAMAGTQTPWAAGDWAQVVQEDADDHAGWADYALRAPERQAARAQADGLAEVQTVLAQSSEARAALKHLLAQ